jgi:hypothetical protein
MTPEAVAATLRAYVRASGALAAAALVEAGTVEVEADGTGSFEPAGSPMTEPLEPGDAAPLALGIDIEPVPPFAVDEQAGEVNAPIGALERAAEGVRALAAAFGGRSAAVVRFPVLDGETDFAMSAREGEGMVVVIGDDHYQMAEGWPGGSGEPPGAPEGSS